MNLFQALDVVRRRWYVVLAVVLLAIGLAGARYLAAESTYTSTATVVVVSAAGGGGEAGDQEIAASGGSDLVLALLNRNLTSPSRASLLVQQGFSGTFATNSARDLPLLTLTVTADDPEGAALSMELLLEETRTTLREVLSTFSIAGASRYEVQVAVPASPVVEVAPERNRAVIAILVGGVLLAFGAAVALDSALAARGERRAPEAVRPAAARTAESNAGARPDGSRAVSTSATPARERPISTPASGPLRALRLRWTK